MSARKVTIGSVARRLGISPQRVRDLDEDLQPERVGEDAGLRVYDLERVEAYVVERARRLAKLSSSRAAARALHDTGAGGRS